MDEGWLVVVLVHDNLQGQHTIHVFVTYLIGLTLVGLITYFQQILSLYLNGPRIGSVTPSGVGVLVVVFGGCLLLLRSIGTHLHVARKHLVILYIMLAVGLPLGALGGASALIACIGRYVFVAGDAGREGSFWFYPIYRSLPLQLWPGYYSGSEVLQFNRGGASQVPWEQWKEPLVLWNIFFGSTILCMVGLGVVLRRRWLEKECLPCPLNEIPGWFLGFGQGSQDASQADTPSPNHESSIMGKGNVVGRSGWRSRALWIGFAIPVVIFLNNGLAHYRPDLFHAMPLTSDFGRLFTEEPLSAMKRPNGGPIPFPVPGLQLTIIPALVAVAFFLPKEISLSIVVFYFAGRLLTAFCSAVEVKWGIPLTANSSFLVYFHRDRIPCLYSMGIGGFLFIALLRSVQLLIVSLKDRKSAAPDFCLGVLFVVGGGASLVAWLVWLGMPVHLAIVAVVGTAVLAVAFTRMRVEGGIPLLFGVPPLAVVLVTLNLTPFTAGYEVVAGNEQEPVLISPEALKAFEQWQMEDVTPLEQSADPVSLSLASSGKIEVKAIEYCTFLNNGFHDRFWDETEHEALIIRRPHAFRNLAGFGVLVLFSYVAVLALPALMLEGFHLAGQARLAWGHVVVAGLLAILVACAVGEPTSLREYYKVGVENFQSTPSVRIHLLSRTWEMHFNDGINGEGGTKREHVDWVRVVAGSIGFTSVGVLTVIRTVFCNFPLAPIGLVVAFLYGSWCWGSVMLGYGAKVMILRFGGPMLYSRAKPFFIGLFCGQVVAMVFWAIVAYWNGDFMNGFNCYIEPGLGYGAVF